MDGTSSGTLDVGPGHVLAHSDDTKWSSLRFFFFAGRHSFRARSRKAPHQKNGRVSALGKTKKIVAADSAERLAGYELLRTKKVNAPSNDSGTQEMDCLSRRQPFLCCRTVSIEHHFTKVPTITLDATMARNLGVEPGSPFCWAQESAKSGLAAGGSNSVQARVSRSTRGESRRYGGCATDLREGFLWSFLKQCRHRGGLTLALDVVSAFTPADSADRFC